MSAFDKLLEKSVSQMDELEYCIVQAYEKGENETAETAAEKLAVLRARVEAGISLERREEIAKELLSVLKDKMMYRVGLPEDGWAIEMIYKAIDAAIEAALKA